VLVIASVLLSSPILFALKMETTRFLLNVGSYKSHIPEEGILHRKHYVSENAPIFVLK
jgi:hypothetical protein